MTDPIRIIYAGTPDFAVPALRRLCEAGYSIVGVYTQPDRPSGRGRELKPSPVKQLALKCDIAVFQPESFKREQETEVIRQLRPDLMVVAAYGLILPGTVLEIPRLGCINIHASLLPRWRGAAPIQRAILAGETQSGITIMQMDEGLDTGAMLLHKSCEIASDDTGTSLHDRLMVLGADVLMEVLPALIAGQIEAKPQDSSLATYANKLQKREAEINWSDSAIQIARNVRAYNAWPVAYTSWKKSEKKSSVMRVWNAIVLDGAISGEPAGTVVHCSLDGIDVATGKGILRLTTVQLPGKRKLSAADFNNAHRLKGQVLGQ